MNPMVATALVELIQLIFGGIKAFANAANIPSDQIDAALREEIEKLYANDPSKLQVPGVGRAVDVRPHIDNG